MKLTIGYFYPHLLNLYGDRGNVEILKVRAQRRGFDVSVIEITPEVSMKDSIITDLNLVFMGGGPDSGQKAMYKDLIKNKREFLYTYINSGGVGLFICGAYQLLGNYYKSADGSVLDGLRILDFYTEHFGLEAPRCVGNVVCKMDLTLLENPLFSAVNKLGDSIVGFENHGGRTFLSSDLSPLAHIKKGFGNNGKDFTEGVLYRNCLGTYLHGPFLSKNSHIADFLIASALKLPQLTNLEDDLIVTAHTASKKLKQ